MDRLLPPGRYGGFFRLHDGINATSMEQKGSPGIATSVGVFKNHRGFYWGSFTMPIGVHFALFVETMAFIIAIKIVCYKGWLPLWVEMDLMLLLNKVMMESMEVP